MYFFNTYLFHQLSPPSSDNLRPLSWKLQHDTHTESSLEPVQFSSPASSSSGQFRRHYTYVCTYIQLLFPWATSTRDSRSPPPPPLWGQIFFERDDAGCFDLVRFGALRYVALRCCACWPRGMGTKESRVCPRGFYRPRKKTHTFPAHDHHAPCTLIGPRGPLEPAGPPRSQGEKKVPPSEERRMPIRTNISNCPSRN